MKKRISMFVAALALLLSLCQAASAATVSLTVPNEVAELAVVSDASETEQHYTVHEANNTAEFVLGYLEYLMQQESMVYICVREVDGWVYHMFRPAEGYSFTTFQFNNEKLDAGMGLCAALVYYPQWEQVVLCMSPEIVVTMPQTSAQQEPETPATIAPAQNTAGDNHSSVSGNSSGNSSSSSNNSSSGSGASSSSGSTSGSTSRCTTCGGDGEVEKDCTSCGGDGKKNCTSCNGKGKNDCGGCYDGEVRCGRCGGTGESYGDVDCSSCGGDGEKRCSSCSGTGERRCTACSGTGDKRCSSCNGSGEKSSRCSSCGGDGRR